MSNQNSPIALLEQTVFSVEEAFNRVSANPSINFRAEAEFAIQIILKNDYAMGIAGKNPQSVRDAVTNVSAIGLSLNPAKRQAYLVPMDGAIQLMISWMGLIEIAVASGSVVWAKAELVYETDQFFLNGLDKLPTHKYNPFSKDRGALIGTYCAAKLHNGDVLTECMDIEAVYEIRDRTHAWKAWKAKQKKCPWVTDEGEMVRKTVIKRAFKSWPRTDRLDKAIHYLNTDGGEGITVDAGVATVSTEAEMMIAAALKTETDADALAYWKANNGLLAKDPVSHAALKKAVADHRKAMQEKDAVE